MKTGVSLAIQNILILLFRLKLYTSMKYPIASHKMTLTVFIQVILLIVNFSKKYKSSLFQLLRYEFTSLQKLFSYQLSGCLTANSGQLLRRQPQACNFNKKETLAHVCSGEFREISRNTFFTEHLWANASQESGGEDRSSRSQMFFKIGLQLYEKRESTTRKKSPSKTIRLKVRRRKRSQLNLSIF